MRTFCGARTHTQLLLQKNPKEYNLEFYQRGKTAGIIDLTQKQQGKVKYKHRFKSLGLEDEYQNFLEFKKSKEQKEQGEKTKEKDQNKEKERNDQEQ